MPGWTGVGSTITFATTAFVGKYRQISGFTRSIESVDATTLDIASADEAISIPGDNPEPSDVTCRVRFQGTQAHPVQGTVETITITMRKETSSSTVAPSVAGSGYIKSWTPIPNLQRNQLNEGELVFRYDGVTGPTYTVES